MPETDGEPAVDVDVVHEHVERAVRGDSDGDPEERGDGGTHRRDGEQQHTDGGEADREQVVALEATVRRCVVAAMPAHAEPVHHVAVGAVADELHRRERADHDQHGRDHEPPSIVPGASVPAPSAPARSHTSMTSVINAKA